MKKSLRRDERGMAHLLLVVLAVVVLAAIGFVGWKVMNSKSNKPATVSNSATTSGTTGAASSVSSTSTYTTCLAQYHDTNVCHFAEAAAASPIDKTAYKATLTSTQNGATSTITFSQDGKGNNSLSTSGGTSGTSLNSITYAGVMYVQNGSVWIKYPSSSTPPTTDPSSDLSFMGSLDKTTFTKVDTEACGSLTCYKYQIKDAATGTSYVWFDTHSYLLREWSANDPTSGAIDMKLSYQPVSISMPSPVEDLSTGE
jgi:hypothetical protein